ncbi:Type I restriction-modification system, specificity subunit S [Geobacillus stearothermophilus]|uniref:Type I restriction-modification system, specificity subunit S n=1 Tax=Geobacillus stearothermophilus TaxID=1422 RepID=A0A150NEL1_GEOSE|nr:restriction endonuclease subunit S [Geobacillus stearothermophilus]KYD35135.1 Type I restriction-modification system, specificity subunit S [Geobacillus stearothermophilus]
MGFETVKLKDLTINLDNKRKPLNELERKSLKKKGLYPYCGANGVLDYIDEFIFDQEILCIAEDGGSWGFREKCAYIMNEPCWVNNHAHVLVAKENVNVKYLCYYLNYADLSKHITGTTRGKLTKSALEKIEVKIPDYSTQNKIVNALDKSQELIDKRKAQIEALDQLTQSVFLEILFRNPEKNTRIKFAEVIKETKNGISRRGNDENGNIVLRLRDIKENLIDYTDVNRIKLNETEKENFRVNLNDLLLIRVNGNPDYVGRSAVFTGYSEEVFFNDHIIRIKTIESVENIFLAYYLNSYIGKKELRKNLKTSAGQYTISREGLNKVNIILPTLEDQKYFVHWFKVIQEKKQLLQQSLVELNNTFNSLMQRAFKGELFND